VKSIDPEEEHFVMHDLAQTDMSGRKKMQGVIIEIAVMRGMRHVKHRDKYMKVHVFGVKQANPKYD